MLPMSDQGQTDDRVRFAQAGVALADAVDAAIESWVVAAVVTRVPEAESEAEIAARACREVIVEQLRALAELDVDEQTTTPLQILRGAVRFPTAVLRAAGVAPAARDQLDAARDPDDVYALAPAAFGDFGPEVGEAGLLWGAAKAYLHLARRREI